MRSKILLTILPVLILASVGACSDAPARAQQDVAAATSDSVAAAERRAIAFRVPNMACSLCANTIEQRLGELGLTEIEIDVEAKRVRAMFDPERLNAERIREAVETLGYSVAEVQTGVARGATESKGSIR